MGCSGAGQVQIDPRRLQIGMADQPRNGLQWHPLCLKPGNVSVIRVGMELCQGTLAAFAAGPIGSSAFCTCWKRPHLTEDAA
jgi:hypothetical protein